MKKHSILLVEDDELDVISVERSLKKLDLEYELYKAFNGNEALNMLTQPNGSITPDVILLDLNMPKMNGIEFLQIIRKKELIKKIKVFILTTSAEFIDRNITEQLGVSGYIIKPLSQDNAKRNDSMDAFMQFHLRKILTQSN